MLSVLKLKFRWYYRFNLDIEKFVGENNRLTAYSYNLIFITFTSLNDFHLVTPANVATINPYSIL